MMAENNQIEHRPIQTSAVIVLGARRRPAVPPPSPPTPCASPSDCALVYPAESFSLEQSERCRLQQKAEETLVYRHSRLDSSIKDNRLRRGLHVLSTEAAALASLAKLYEHDDTARDGFDRAVQAITRQGLTNGKVVIIGVGKSGHIGRKLVATMQSLDVRAVFLHPTEALHGDLGIIDAQDTLMFITYSGQTQEIMLMLPHLDDSLPTILLTSHTQRETCEFIKRRPHTILVPAPIPKSEQASFGVSAPSTSTTVALALGDALAITAANEMHRNVSAAFAKNHPGGAIGAAAKSPKTIRQICVPLADIPSLEELGYTWNSLGIDVLRAGFDSRSGWVRIGDKLAAPSRIRQISSSGLNQALGDLPNIFTSHRDMVAMSCDTTILQASSIIRVRRGAVVDGVDSSQWAEAIIGVTDGESLVGVLEACHVLELRSSGSTR